MHRRRLSGVIWAYPRSFPDLTTVSPVQADVVRTETAPSATPNTGTSTLVEKTGPEIVQSLPLSNEGYVMKKGEGLFSIARKLKIGNYHPAQIVIAIWMHNIDKFIFGNINCQDVHPDILSVIDDSCIPNQTIKIAPKTAIKASFGFGDVNACVIFKKFYD